EHERLLAAVEVRPHLTLEEVEVAMAFGGNGDQVQRAGCMRVAQFGLLERLRLVVLALVELETGRIGQADVADGDGDAFAAANDPPERRVFLDAAAQLRGDADPFAE